MDRRFIQIARSIILCLSAIVLGLGVIVTTSSFQVRAAVSDQSPESASSGLAPSSADPASSGPTEYRLGRGDRVRVTVFGHEDLSGEFDVGAAGSVSLPLVGDVPAQDRTAGQLEDAIRQKLQPDYLTNPRVSVQVLKYRPFYILGEVKNPGSYPYSSGMTVINAVALAGGYTYRARQSKIFIIRENAPGKKERVDQNTMVLPGDTIEVSERFF